MQAMNKGLGHLDFLGLQPKFKINGSDRYKTAL